MKYTIVFEEIISYKPLDVDASDENEAYEMAKEALDFGYIDVVETDTIVTEITEVTSVYGTRVHKTTRSADPESPIDNLNHKRVWCDGNWCAR